MGKLEAYLPEGGGFDQEELLAIKGITDPAAKHGVCLSLVILWVRLFKKEVVTPHQRMYNLSKELSNAAFYQAVLQDLWTAKARQSRTGSINESDKAAMYSIVSQDQQIQFQFLKSFVSHDPFCTYIDVAVGNGYPHCVDVLFAGTSAPKGMNHAIGVIKTPSKLIVFDPNYGEMHIERQGDKIKDFGIDFWSTYLNDLGVLDRKWTVYRLSGNGTKFAG